MRVNGWDERDYKLWSDLQSLPSYGLIGDDSDNPLLSRKQVVALLEKHANARFEAEWAASLKSSEGAK